MNDTQQKLTPELVSMAIESGMLDASLPALKDVVHARLEIIQKRAAGTLDKGDRFFIKDCKPKKWNGIEVEFLGHDGQWLECRIVSKWDVPQGKSDKINLRPSHVGTIIKQGSAL